MREKYIVVAFDEPNPNSRTGHAAIHAGSATSLYHNTTPNNVRKKPFQSHPLASPVTLTLDQKMRGLSWIERDKQREKAKRHESNEPESTEKESQPPEEKTVSMLLAQLDTELDQAKIMSYAKKGQYQHIFLLPTDAYNRSIVEKELRRIKEIGQWSMFGPTASYLFEKKESHNCSTAILSALEKGKKESTSIPWQIKLIFWAGYFLGLINSEKQNRIDYLPLIYLAYRLKEALQNAILYARDFISMEKKPGSANLLLILSIYAASCLINLIGAPVNTHLCRSIFTFPADVLRYVRGIDGVEKIEFLPPDLENEKQPHSPQSARRVTFNL